MARYDLMALLAKAETTYGTDPTPTGGANAVLLQDVDWTPIEHEEVARPRVNAFYGNDPIAVMGRRSRWNGSVDLASSGTAGTAPAWGSLIKACSMSEVVNAGTSVEYVPQTAGSGSIAAYHYLDGTVHKGLGMRGDWSLMFAARQVPKLSFDFQGLYVAASAASIPSLTLTGWKDAPVVGFTDTATAQLDGYDVRLASFTYKHGVQLAYRDLPNARSIVTTGWQSSAEITIEAPDALAKDYLALVGTDKAVVIEHGTAGGSTIRFDLFKATLTRPRYSNVDGIAHLTFALRPVPNTGNDQCKLTAK